MCAGRLWTKNTTSLHFRLPPYRKRRQAYTTSSRPPRNSTCDPLRGVEELRCSTQSHNEIRCARPCRVVETEKHRETQHRRTGSQPKQKDNNSKVRGELRFVSPRQRCFLGNRYTRRPYLKLWRIQHRGSG